MLLYESRSAFFQGCGELNVLFVSFDERFDARLEGLVICEAVASVGLIKARSGTRTC